MAKGPKPTPKKLQKLRGNPRKAKMTAPADPQFETAIPEPPTHLEGAALQEWNRITQELATKQIITHVDQAILGLYCQAYADWVRHSEVLKDESDFFETIKGYRYQNPRIGLINTLGDKLAKYAAELGITPSSRNKVKMIGKAPTEKTKEQALAERLFRAPVSK